MLDVGAGAGVLPDRLVAAGWTDVTVLDVSAAALDVLRARLGDAASYVCADLLAWRPARAYGRLARPGGVPLRRGADAGGVRRGRGRGRGAGRGGGRGDVRGRRAGIVLRMPVARYDAGGLAAAFGEAFEPEHAEREEHDTPWGAVQPFTWVVLRRR